ncbi:bifunctional 5,10-methylenetetrahydrofolate dehydrogenase/5,10-methenyltetrahydrofolate cyclohydrolase [Phycisphaera mikurensis]|uniref:Bifunctional protein FolD n=1 Tax=Phycisphaera mikurensis (strain NBRC 102666 / KCTC 22515 / FYK2301M01) TaxID=1142394 RepID=I0IEK5_PHYMF|nr:tetrahydrofolate dehydrogenase/cyclohydrolase catalytic domain-containing protein [Phycisphaera mikurensis]MBB6441492.1 methylenetetrahydrofolate dehydrogenase (NADP+)/methenyltetrahydrofolate cyclohydrolase [Phycisphaera mikurensis]BAM03693.1 methylenetetrahydrofolate dehydrogenase/methenyltetrahydrofolate cyclohydrolase [Phycisphaera mikurensis NBRC 102666]
MPAELLDGTKTANEILGKIRSQVAVRVAGGGSKPTLATVLVGADPASITYTRMKRKRCESVGMRSLKVELPAETTTEQLLAEIEKLGNDPGVHGILLQHPCPPHIDERAAFEAIPTAKDVDGVTLGSFADMWFGLGGFDSCTPGGIMRLLRAYDLPLSGKRAVVIGRSAILGKPMAGLLLAADATVTICHSRTPDVAAAVREADVVVAAVGRAEFVKGDWIKPGAVVADAGYNAGNVGDVEHAAAAERAAWITPVPGGVGPMTIATLLEQTLVAAERDA